MKKEHLLYILQAIFIVLILTVVTPVIIGDFYTTLCEDDFSYESGGKQIAAEMESAFKASVARTLLVYKEQQGCYMAMFLDHFIMPYTRFGLTGFHVVMVILTLMMLASLYLLSRELAKERTAYLAVFLAAVVSTYALIKAGDGAELFFWYTCVIGYILGFSLALFSAFFLIRAIRTESSVVRGIDIAASCICGFMASGFALMITSLGCAFLLLITIICFDRVKERKVLFLPFIAAFAGALINVAAPGNFVRSGDDMKEGHETVFDAVRDTFVFFGTELRVVMSLAFLAVLLLVFAVCFCLGIKVIKKGISTTWMILLVLAVFLIQYFTAFPAAFGYHTAELSDHTAAVFDLLARYTTIFLVMCLAQFVNERVGKRNLGKYFIAAAAVMACLTIIIPGARNRIREGFSAAIVRDLKSGDMMKTYQLREYALSYFEMAEDGSDAVIFMPYGPSSESMYSFGITTNSEDFVNMSAANLFGVHTTTIIYPD